MFRWLLLGIWLAATSMAQASDATMSPLSPDEKAWLDHHKTITVGIVRENWPPYQTYSHGRLEGLSADYLRAITGELHIDFEPKVYPSLLALMAALCRGDVDLVMNVNMTPGRTQCLAFSEPYLDVPPVIVARKDSTRYHNDNGLGNARIAYEKDTATENWIERRLPSATGIPVADTPLGLRMVEEGRADMYLGDPYVIAHYLGDEAKATLGIYNQGRIASRTIHFAAPRDRLPLLDALNAALLRMTPEQHQQIRARWLNATVGVGVRDTGLNLTREERQWLASLPPLKLGFDPNWAPIAYVDANGHPSGIASDYLDRVASSLGIEFIYVPSRNWGETLQLARHGKVDIVAPLNALPSPDGNLIYTQPFASFSDVIVVSEKRASPVGVDDLAGLRVVISDPREIPESIRRRMTGASITLVGDVGTALDKVANGSADAYIGNAAVADLQIRSRFAGQLKIAASADIVSAQSLGVSREYARLVPYLNQALASIPEKEQQRIRSTWLWSTYTSGLDWRTFWKTAAVVGGSVLAVIALILTAYLRLRREVRQRVVAERQLADQLSFREALMESLPYPLVAKDTDNRYLAVNHAYEESFGIGRARLIGQTTEDSSHYSSEWNRRFHQLTADALHTGNHYHAELRLPDATGKERTWLYWIRPFQRASGHTGGLLAALVDVTDIREAEERASALDLRLKRITAHLPAVVFELRRAADGTLSFPYVGGNTQAMWDLSAQDMESNERAAFARVHPEDQAVIERAVEASVATMQPISIVFRSIVHGRERWISAEATPQREEHGQTFWSGVWTDVTEARAQAEALAQAKEEAEAAAAAKASFLATMSHEIRTPMNGLLGLLELLRDGPLTANQQWMLRMVDDSAATLMQILNDILDFSKIEAGQLTLSPTPVDLRSLVDNVLAIASTLAHEKGLHVRNAIDPQLAAEFMGDGVRLRQILFNLLSNATKFTEEGAIDVRLDVLASDPARQRIRLTVRDSGIGMTAEQQRRLFEPFVQADASIARRFGGTGLGLTICRRLVELMDGTLAMHSAPGEGTAMVIELALPVHRMHAPPILPGRRALLALAADEAAVLAGLLAPLGMMPAGTGDTASLRFVDELDLSSATGQTMPTIVVTDEPSPLGYTIEPDGTCMLSRNPFSSAAIEACCRRAFGMAAAGAETEPAVYAPRTEHPGLVLVAEDHPTNRLLIQEQLQRLSYRCLTVGDGVEALEALSTHDDVALLITDCDMPRMDGYTLAATIRAAETADHRLPILALTASAMPGEARRCADAGMDAMLLKPASLASLRDALLNWMPAPASPLAPEPQAAASALDRLFGTDARRTALVDGFVESVHDDLGQLERAIDQGDAAESAGRIHRMNGAIKIFGADALAEQGETLRSELLAEGVTEQGRAQALRYRLGVLQLIESLKPSQAAP